MNGCKPDRPEFDDSRLVAIGLSIFAGIALLLAIGVTAIVLLGT